MTKIEVVDYRPEWKEQFSQIKDYLSNYFPNYEIIHVGSTSIENCSAKPIIDIDMVIPDINHLPAINEILKQLGFRFQGDLTIEGRYAYYCENKSLPKCHFYVSLVDGQGFVEHLKLKQHLLKNPHKVAEYSKLKKQLAKKFPYDIEKYIDGKAAFIMNAMKQEGYIRPNYQTILPDFNKSLINVISSIQKHFQVTSKYPSLASVDEVLKGAKHIVLLVLDGMGKNILEYHLSKRALLRQKVIDYVTSLYPPTTVAVTTALRTGKLPGETGWVGWHQFFEKYQEHIVMFQGINYYTEAKLDVPYLQDVPITPFYQMLKGVLTQELYPAFMPGGYQTLKDMMDKIITITNDETKPSFTYAYWGYPDSLIHMEGCYDASVTECLKDINQQIKYLNHHINDDTVVLIVADHGLVDIKHIYLDRFPDIAQYLIQKPAIESRFASFYVNDLDGFETTFNLYFSSYFDLYRTADLLKTGVLGDEYQKASNFLGDFVAIAKHKYAFEYGERITPFKATHAGALVEEMIVPVIAIKRHE